jgi:hypothetical protein
MMRLEPTTFYWQEGSCASGSGMLRISARSARTPAYQRTPARYTQSRRKPTCRGRTPCRAGHPEASRACPRLPRRCHTRSPAPGPNDPRSRRPRCQPAATGAASGRGTSARRAPKLGSGRAPGRDQDAVPGVNRAVRPEQLRQLHAWVNSIRPQDLPAKGFAARIGGSVAIDAALLPETRASTVRSAPARSSLTRHPFLI